MIFMNRDLVKARPNLEGVPVQGSKPQGPRVLKLARTLSILSHHQWGT